MLKRFQKLFFVSFSKTKAFTIIELLVVISILGLLSSVVLVSMEGAEDRANIGKAMEFSHIVRVSLGADLVGEWRLNESAGTEAKDSSGNDNHGTLVDFVVPGWTDQGVFNNALVFDGNNDYVELAAAFYDPYECTFEFWGYVEGTDNKNTLGSDWRSDAAERGFDILIVAVNRVRVELINGQHFDTDVGTIKTDRWHHIVAVVSVKAGHILNIYVDGKLEKTETVTLPASRQATAYRLGRRGLGGDFFNGIIDEVRVYDWALSTTEIQQLYAQGTAKHDIVLK